MHVPLVFQYSCSCLTLENKPRNLPIFPNKKQKKAKSRQRYENEATVFQHVHKGELPYDKL
jgi:hypothetical protein